MKPINEQVILITGSTDGIGKQTAYDLARMGATILLHGRNQNRAEVTFQGIQEATGNEKVKYYVADFTSLDEMRCLAKELQAKHRRLDVLINNAGIGAGKNTDRASSQDGYELRFAVNYLAPFLLTQLLLPCLRCAAPSRIINVSSAGQSPINFADVMLERSYDPMPAYCHKLALVLFTINLAEQLKDDKITVNCLHPGSRLNTKMVREMFGYSTGSVQTGADAVVYLATSQDVTQTTGKYFDRKREAQANSQADDQEAQKRLWRLSQELTGIQDCHSG